MEKLYTCEEVAERYGVKLRTVWDWVRARKITATKIGKCYRFSECDLNDFEANGRKG